MIRRPHDEIINQLVNESEFKRSQSRRRNVISIVLMCLCISKSLFIKSDKLKTYSKTCVLNHDVQKNIHKKLPT